MFCYNCGTSLKNGANFCPVCGARQGVDAAETAYTAVPAVSASADFGMSAIAGPLHHEFYQMATTFGNDFAESYTKKYTTLDGFVKKANVDVDAIFEQVNERILQFLSSQGIYSYGHKQIHQISRKFVGEWSEVFNNAVLAYQKITGELQNTKLAREYGKATRGQVVGGGFGVSGAIKGMATAGAVNMATGALYSLANSFANSRSERKASEEKNRFYYSKNLKEAIRLAVSYDCYAMLEAVREIWEKEKRQDFPFYSAADFERACNIRDKINQGEIPVSNYAAAIMQMLDTYPVSEDLYIFADRLIPDDDAIWDKAEKYGFDFDEIRERQSKEQQIAALGLCRSPLFAFSYEDIIYDLGETLENVSQKYSEFLDLLKPSVVLLTMDEKEKPGVQKNLQKMHHSFAEYGTDEVPLLMYDSTMFSSGTEGILLTDRYLYFKGEMGRKCYIDVDEFDKDKRQSGVEPVSDNGTCLIYKYYLDAEQNYYLYVSGGMDGAEQYFFFLLIDFLCAFCRFLHQSNVNLNQPQQAFSLIYKDIERITGESMGEVYEDHRDLLELLHLTEETSEGTVDLNNDDEMDLADEDSENSIEPQSIICNMENDILDKALNKTVYHKYLHPALNMNQSEQGQFGKISSLYPAITNDEEVLFFYDNTMFSNMKESFLITTKGIHFLSERLDSGFVPYTQLKSVAEKQIKLFPNLIINGKYTIPMRFLSDCSGEIVKLVTALQELLS